MDKQFIEKVLAVQAELKAPKGKRNTFGNYNYRSCEDILEAAKPILAKQGLLLTISDKTYESPSGWHFVEATATLTDGDAVISVSASARESEDKKGCDVSQITGAASSYARKYALNGLLLIDDTKDADTDEYTAQTRRQEKPQAEPITKEQLQKISDLCTAIKKPTADLLAAYKVEHLDQLTKAQGDGAIKRLEEMKAAKK